MHFAAQDTVKTVAMSRVARRGKVVAFESPLLVAASIYRAGGRPAFFTGLAPAVLRAFPSHATVFLVYTNFLAYSPLLFSSTGLR